MPLSFNRFKMDLAVESNGFPDTYKFFKEGNLTMDSGSEERLLFSNLRDLRDFSLTIDSGIFDI